MPCLLWVAERILEANLLAANGLAMSNQARLAYTIAFITADERLVLQVPSLQERSLFDAGRGYELTDLENSINHMDVTTLKPFRQSACLPRPSRAANLAAEPHWEDGELV
jgi:hypothetical protein